MQGFPCLFVMLQMIDPFFILIARKVYALPAVIDLPAFAARAQAAVSAFTAQKEKDSGFVPAACAQGRFFHDGFGPVRFSNPSLTSDPRDQRFRCFYILLCCDPVLTAHITVNAAGSHFQRIHQSPSVSLCMHV
jgi:hypothetical protein